MFTKSPTIKPLAPIKSSERKKLLTTVCTRLKINHESLPAETKNSLFPKNLKVGKILLHNGSKGSLIVDAHDKPIWVDINNKLVPTILTLWKCPFILQRTLVQENTIQYLENGADLMARGIFEPYPIDIKKGDLVAVATLKNPTVPIAVGISLINFDELNQIQSGKAVQIVNVINDKLLVPGAGPAMIVPDELNTSTPKASDEAIETDTNETPETTDRETTDKETTDKETTEKETTDQSLEKGIQNIDLEDLPTDQIDRALKRSFLQVLKKSIETPLEYPVPSNTFSSLMTAELPFHHASIQMKKSSWKKANKFFKSMEKENLIKCRERNGELVILSAALDNPEISQFELFRPAKSSTSKSSNESTPISKILMTEYWRPRSAATDIFSKLKLDKKGYYTNDQLRKYLNTYLTTFLDKSIKQPKEKKFIIPDKELQEALKGAKENERISRSKMLEMLQANCSQFHTITAPGQPESKLIKGPFPKIQIKTEKRIGNKVVTKIVGLESFFLDPGSFAEELKVACAGSSTVSPVTEGSKLQQILIQGDHIKTVVRLLTDKGMRNDWIDVDTKSRPRKH